MIAIDVQQVKTRLRTIPENLREVFYSPQTAEAIDRIGMENHLSDNKVSAVAEAAGLALLGFIHAEELTGEIQGRAQVDARVAQGLAASLQNRILNSIRADLDKIYAPVGEEPARVEDISKPVAVAGTPPAAAPPAPMPAPRPGGLAPKPFLDLTQLSKPAPVGGVPVPPTAPTGKVSPMAASFLRQKAESQTVKTGEGFKLKLDMPLPPTSTPGAFSRPAQLEIGQQPTGASKESQVSSVESAPARTVHYSQWRTPLQAPAPPDASAAPKPAPMPIGHLSSPPAISPAETPKIDTAPARPEVKPGPPTEPVVKKPDTDAILAKLAPDKKNGVARVVNFDGEKPVPPTAGAPARPVAPTPAQPGSPPLRGAETPPPAPKPETPPKAGGGTVDLSSL